jgi:glucokinase
MKPNAMPFPLPALICDVGGTNIRIARLDEPGAPARVIGHVATHAVTSFVAAIRETAGALPARSMIVCAAGPVRGRRVQLTNADWALDGPETAAALGLDQGLLLHDFEALALSLPAFDAAWLRPIGQVPARPGGPRLVLGPGTGLGAATLATVEGRFLALASEAGHVDFGPVGPEEQALWPHLTPVGGRITSESVLSGPGLARLHRARLAAGKVDVAPMVPSDIVSLALQHPTGEEARTARLFWRLVARFAGDLALVTLARGGVTLAGGILPRIAPLLDDGAFRAAFEAKHPMEELMGGVPTALLTRTEAVLDGMAAIITAPERYLIDYAARAWR